MKKSKLVVLGSVNVDHVLSVNQFPRPGETLLGSHYQIAFGGKGANQAVAAGRSGADISFIAAVGQDDVGDRIRQQLVQDNIDVSSMEIIKSINTGVALIFVNADGENSIGISAGANAAVTPEYMNKYRQQIIEADALLTQLEIPIETVLAAAKLAKESATLVILNPAPAQSLSDELLALIDLITPNETEAERLTGIAVKDEADAQKAAAILHTKGIETVIITLGSRGAWVSVNGQGERVCGYKVSVVDTIAAGDTFNGALVTALLEGQPLISAIKFAQAAAAVAVTRAGAQPSVPWRHEIDTFLQQHSTECEIFT